MLLYRDSHCGGALLAVHVTDFGSVRAARRWRRHAQDHLPAVAGLVFAKAMPFIGSSVSAGFGGGVPALSRQVLLTAWRREVDFDRFLSSVAAPPAGEGRHCWWSLFDVASTRGSHFGSNPLSGGDPGTDGQFAALTLGRIRPRSLARFLREGARLGPLTRRAPGLVSAVSAGWPRTGNCTLSIWESEQHMLDFAYRDRDGHGHAVRRNPPILLEQLNARLRLRRLHGNWGRGTMHPDRLARLASALR